MKSKRWSLRRPRFLVLSGIFTLGAIASGWYALSLERQNAAVSYCRRQNLANIFVFNALPSSASAAGPLKPALAEAVLPSAICYRWIDAHTETSTAIGEYRARVANMTLEQYEELAGGVLKSLGDTYNRTEDRISSRQFYALVLVAVLNMLALASQSRHLQQDET